MSSVDFETTIDVRDTCLCLHVQRAARLLARHFDAALQPAGVTNEQFSLLNALNRPSPASMGDVARLLGADRTTLTAALKPLLRDGLARTAPDVGDRRVRRVALTDEGHARLAAAVPLWRNAHCRLDERRDIGDLDGLRTTLSALARGTAALDVAAAYKGSSS